MSSSTVRQSFPRYSAFRSALTDLALDLRWSFNHSADKLWERLDPELWDLTHNPWVVLQTVSREKLQSVTCRPGFPDAAGRSCIAKKGRPKQPEGWFQKSSSSFRSLHGRLFLHGVHVERSAADLFGRTRQRGRRSAQGREQSGRSGDRRRSALPAGIFSAGNRRAGTRSRLCIHSTIPASCRFRPLRERQRRMAAPVHRLSRREALDSHLAGAGGPSANCICSTRTIPRIFRRIAASPANCTAAVPNCA